MTTPGAKGWPKSTPVASVRRPMNAAEQAALDAWLEANGQPTRDAPGLPLDDAPEGHDDD